MPISPFRDRVVMVVDDDDDMRHVARHLLQSLGARVVVAADGFEALVHLERLIPDVVLCDLTMPVMDGLEFAARVRREPRYRHMLLVAMTARQSDADIRQTWSVGFDAHLVKPITLQMLHAIAQRLPGKSAADAHRGA